MTDIIAAVSQVIRRVDGNHTMGAGALAEAILEHRAEWDTPRIIRTVEELEALDPDTLVKLGDDREIAYVGKILNTRRLLGWRPNLPAVVICEGAQVRAAREALEEA